MKFRQSGLRLHVWVACSLLMGCRSKGTSEQTADQNGSVIRLVTASQYCGALDVYAAEVEATVAAMKAAPNEPNAVRDVLRRRPAPSEQRKLDVAIEKLGREGMLDFLDREGAAAAQCQTQTNERLAKASAGLQLQQELLEKAEVVWTNDVAQAQKDARATGRRTLVWACALTPAVPKCVEPTLFADKAVRRTVHEHLVAVRIDIGSPFALDTLKGLAAGSVAILARDGQSKEALGEPGSAAAFIELTARNAP